MNDYTPPQRSVSVAELAKTYQQDTRSPRKKFVDEAFIKVNQSRKGKFYNLSEARISIMINQMCPKEGGDALVIDTQKACQEADMYWVAFWGIYNKAVGRKPKKVVKLAK